MATILVGVTGCIAAYKACELVRMLQKRGHDVKVVMTEHATQFVGAATFRALTGHEVAVELFDEAAAPVHHISLAKEADLFLIAPCTANVMAKLARGMADDLLTTTALAASCPLVVAPAMNTNMWEAQATRENVGMLEARGVEVVAPGSGYLACGDAGAGRLAELDDIVDAALAALERPCDLEGRSVLITAGPTREMIDPVRCITNLSSGRMGYALAAEAAARGAQVTLVAGPVALSDPAGIAVVHVESAQDMLDACRAPFADADIAVFVAAVSDWRAQSIASSKQKKHDGMLELTLVPTVDVAATLAANKDDTFVVAFAAETENVVAYAQGKLKTKHADLVVANDVSETGFGMGSTRNHVWLVDEVGAKELAPASKREVARRIFEHIAGRVQKKEAD